MGWEVYERPLDTSLIEDALYTSGKALFISNHFEMRCKHLFRMAHLVELIEAPFRLDDITADPVRTLVDVFTTSPERHQNLSRIVEDFIRMAPIGEHEVTALTRAKDARDVIAHGGADIGSLAEFDLPRMCAFLHKLRAAVADLAVGDAVVSGWLYVIDNKGPVPAFMVDNYPDTVDRFVFGHIPPEWLEENDVRSRSATGGDG